MYRATERMLPGSGTVVAVPKARSVCDVELHGYLSQTVQEDIRLRDPFPVHPDPHGHHAVCRLRAG